MSVSPGPLLNNRYRICGMLGQGGFGAVYLADDTRLQGLRVAIKENFDNSAAAQQQFQFEAGVLARLAQGHPGLPRVSDYFIEPSGRQYLVMDYVQGDDLQKILQLRGRLSEAEALAGISQVMDALEYLHSQQPPIIHRDIKPANIKIRPDGKAVLVDFGIAKAFQGSARTMAGARGATDGFSPLEQYQGGTTVQSDIYALGATLYCLLTGRVPPSAPDRVAGAALVSPRQMNPSLSPQTEQALVTALALPPQQRFATMRQFRQALPPGGSTRGTVAPRPAFPAPAQTLYPSRAAPAPYPSVLPRLSAPAQLPSRPAPAARAAAAPTVAGAPTLAPQTITPYVNLADFSDRFVAYLVDSILVMVLTGLSCLFTSVLASVMIVFLTPSGSTTSSSYSSSSSTAASTVAALMMLLAYALPLIIPAIYFVYFHAATGQTIGKRMMRLQVVTVYGTRLSFGRSLGRYLATFLSGIFFYLGYFWVLGDAKRQGWHDKIAGTYVVKI